MNIGLSGFLRRAAPFPMRVALVRWRDGRQFRAEEGAFRLERGELADYPHLLASHRSPLRRPGTTYDSVLQAGKEVNVALATGFISGSLLPPGGVFSFHHAVGEPSVRRGFAPGPELHDGKLETGIGGGACQVSNLLYVLALLAGARVVERHRHGFDLFPDSERTIPFGCGATVFYPKKDLRFLNPSDEAWMLHLAVRDGWLVGEARTQEAPAARYEVFEMEGSITQEGSRWVRKNKVGRRRILPDGSIDGVELVCENQAVCLYDPRDRQ